MPEFKERRQMMIESGNGVSEAVFCIEAVRFAIMTGAVDEIY